MQEKLAKKANTEAASSDQFCSGSKNTLEPRFVFNGKIWLTSDKISPLTDKKARTQSELLSEELALRKCMLYRCV